MNSKYSWGILLSISMLIILVLYLIFQVQTTSNSSNGRYQSFTMQADWFEKYAKNQSDTYGFILDSKTGALYRVDNSKGRKNGITSQLSTKQVTKPLVR